MKTEGMALAMGVICVCGVACSSTTDDTQDAGPRVTELTGSLRGAAVHFTASAFKASMAPIACVDRPELNCEAKIWEVTAVETLSSCPKSPAVEVIVPGGDAVMAFQIFQRGLSDGGVEATPSGTVDVVFGMQRDNPGCDGGFFDFEMGSGTFTFDGPIQAGVDGTLNASIDGGADTLMGSVHATECAGGSTPFRDTLFCQ